MQAQSLDGAASFHTRFDDLLHRLGGELGLSRLKFDERRNCFLKFDDIVVRLRHPGGEQLEMTCAVAVLKQSVRAALLEKLLAANLRSCGRTIALDASSRTLLLQDHLHVERADLPALRERLKTLIDCAEHWRRELPRGEATPMQAC